MYTCVIIIDRYIFGGEKMTETKYKKFLNIILVIVVIAIVGVIGYVVYEYIYLRNIIDANASDILDVY